MSSLNLKTILDNLPEKTIATVHKDPDVDAIGSSSHFISSQNHLTKISIFIPVTLIFKTLITYRELIK